MTVETETPFYEPIIEAVKKRGVPDTCLSNKVLPSYIYDCPDHPVVYLSTLQTHQNEKSYSWQ